MLLSASAAGTLLPCHTQSPWDCGPALAACCCLDDNYLQWGLEDARASLAISTVLLQPEDAKKAMWGPREHWRPLAVTCLLGGAWAMLPLPEPF